MTILTIGGVRATRIEESYEPNFDAAMFFADWRPEIPALYPWIAPDHYDPASGMLKLSVHSWLLEAGSKKILIDTCVGNHKHRPHRPKWHRLETPYLARLAAAGVRPEEIDLVMCSHLHVDHVGWNTRLENGRWVPTFPMPSTSSARRTTTISPRSTAIRRRGRPAAARSATACCRWSRRAWRRWSAAAGRWTNTSPTSRRPATRPAASRSSSPIVGSRRRSAATCCITPSRSITRNGTASPARDAANARFSRRRVLEHCAGSGARLMPAHFGQPFTCRIERAGDGFRPRF